MTNSPAHHGASPRDSAFPALTAEEAKRLRFAVGEAFSRAGRQVRVEADAVRDVDGGVFELRPLVMSAANADVAERVRVLDEQVHALIQPVDADAISRLGVEAALERVFPRVVPSDSPLAVGVPSEVLARGEDRALLQILVLDDGETIRPLSRVDLDRLGGDDIVATRASANLAALHVVSPEVVEGPGGAQYRVVADESVHTASVLSSPQRFVPEGSAPHGALFVVPNRHVIAWHVMRDASVAASINALMDFADSHARMAPHPVSSDLLWWDGSAYHLIAIRGADGAISVNPTEAFGRALGKLLAS